jgi:hypothetical protein
VDDRVTGNKPAPERFRICGFTTESSARLTDPIVVPDRTGMKLTVNVHAAAGASAPPHGWAPALDAEKFPAAEMLEIFTTPALELVTFTVLATLVVPATTLAKIRLAGAKLSGLAGPLIPEPESPTTCGDSAPL